MEFGVLGPVEARQDGELLPTGSGRERFVLAALLLNADRLTTVESLIDGLWPAPPASAKAQLHNLVSKLRSRLRAAGADPIATRAGGYELRLDGHRLDLAEFRDLAAKAARAAGAGDHAGAVALWDRALRLWRGSALADVSGEQADAAREPLHEERLVVAESRLDAALRLGRYDSVLRDVTPLLAEQPYREPLHRLRMLALAGAGRRSEALTAYREAYRRFMADLGVPPGSALRDLEQRILRGEPVTAALARTRVAPRQLPPLTAAWTGRDVLVDRICAGLRETPAALLVGPGGVGKSALAVAVGRRMLGAYPDGALYADLRGSQASPAEPYDVMGRFLRALGVESPPRSSGERLAAYRRELAGRRVLLVLDDAGDADQVTPLLPEPAGPAVVVTSRRQLATLPAARHPVPTLSLDDSVRLLACTAGEARVAAEPDAATAIAQACGGLPLALCVAGARLAARPEWTLSEVQDRLRAERRRLDELAVGDLDVRASIELSYRALPDQVRALFRQLSLLPGGDWPAWTADALAGGDVAALLSQLADVHLLETVGADAVGQSRHRLHDLVAAYAAERHAAEKPHERESLRRLLRGWLALATVADERVGHGRAHAAGLPADQPPQAPAELARERPREWFEAERANLLAAVELACRHGEAALAGMLALRLAGFLMLRAYDADRERSLRTAVACVRPCRDDVLLCRLLGALFEAYAQRGAHAKLADVAAEELAVARRLADSERELRALFHVGYVAKVAGRLRDAAAAVDEAMALLRGSGAPPRDAASFLLLKADIHVDAGDSEPALPLLEESRRAEGEDVAPRQRALFLHSYGTALTEAGKLTEAAAAATEAMAINQEIGDDLGLAHNRHSLAVLDLRRGDPDAAAQRLDQALRTLQQLRHQAGVAEVLRTSGDLSLVRGEPAAAVRLLERSLEIWRQLDTPLEIARTLGRLERALLAAGDPAAAAERRAEWTAVTTDLGLTEACLRLPPYLPAPSR